MPIAAPKPSISRCRMRAMHDKYVTLCYQINL